MTNEMWGHKCSDGSGMAIAKGEPCNWCDATEPAAPAQAAEPVANERDKFEAFARSRPGRLALDLETWSIDDDGYTSSDTAFAWEVWQARAALAAAPQPAEPSADERERVLREHRLYRAGIVAAPAATVPDGVPVVQEAQPSLTERLQQKCSCAMLWVSRSSFKPPLAWHWMPTRTRRRRACRSNAGSCAT
jgi:hypothetical protein